jgi:lysophospholipase L1-like esterase
MRIDLLFVGLAFVASASAQDAGPPRRVPTHIAIIGDSITAGVGVSSSESSYYNRLAGMFGASVQMASFARPGSTLQSDSVAPTAPFVDQPEYTSSGPWIDAAGPDSVTDVVIMLGTNDAAPQNWPREGASAAQFANDYNALIDHYAALSSHPVIYMVLPPTIYLDDPTMNTNLHDGVIPVIRQVAMERGLPIIDVNTPTAGRPDTSADGLHPNDAGHLIIAQTMYAALTGAEIPMMVPRDAGTVADDAGVRVDAGVGIDGGVAMSAGGCSVGARSRSDAGFSLLLLAILVLHRNRFRRGFRAI